MNRPLSHTTKTNQPKNISSTEVPSKKQNGKPLPPRPASKVNYDMEINMTESKVFKAKQGLTLLKRKMSRTGMSRDKSRSKSAKADQNTATKIVSKENGSTRTEIEKKIEVEPIQKDNREQEPLKFPKFQEKVISTESVIQEDYYEEKYEEEPNENKYDEVFNDEDERPISNQVDFMELLERQIQKNQPLSLPSKENKKNPREQQQDIILEYCHMGCGRMFNPEVLQKHQKVCQKVFQGKRKAFDSAAHRQIQAQNYQKFAKTTKNKVQKPKAKSQIPKWKVQSAKLRAGIRAASKANKELSPLNEEDKRLLQMDTEILKQCQFCKRKFNEQAALKHIPFCQRKSKQIGKNGPLRRK